MDSVLLVEDSNSFASLFRDRVRAALNVDVVVAESYSKAQELIADEKKNFSIVVLGLFLPDAPNGEAIDFVLSEGIACIVLTAVYKNDLQQSLLAKGVLDYFVKDNLGVIDAVAHAIGHYIRNKHIQILVVDDSRSVRLSLSKMLSRYGYNVVEAEDGRAGLKKIAQQPVHLIISDYQMPNMDGLQMVKKLRTRFTRDEMAVIGLSSVDNSDLAVQFIKAGANDFLLKPYRPEELLCRVFQNIELIERHKELGGMIARHESVLSHALDAIITIDANGRVLNYNPAAEKLFGYPKGAILGKRVEDFFVPEELRQVHCAALNKCSQQDLKTNQLKRRMEMPGIRADGKVIDLQLSITSNVLDGEVNFTAFIQDITDKKQLLISLEETLGEAEAANRAKSEFLANMSHEIRTPMNAVLGFTDLALKADISDKVRDYLHKTENASRSLMGIINDILDFSKVGAGRLDLAPVKFDLHQLFDNLADLFSKQVADKNIELLLFIPITFDKVLFADVLRLEQILINLIRNAVKFTPKGSIVVSCSPVEIGSDQYRLDFAVVDTGIGVEEEVIPNLFAAFVQADSSTTREYGGTGLGLSICKQLVTLMGGNIGVTSTFGKGSSFTFDVIVGLHSESRRTRGTIPEALWGKKTLLIDDNPQSQRQIGDLLQYLQLVPTVVSSGKEGLALLQEGVAKGETFELLFVDWGLSDNDGLGVVTEIIATLKAQAPDIALPRIYLLTPFGVELIKTEGEKIGINGFLDKPVTYSRLLNTVRQDFSAVAKRSDRRESKELGQEEQTALRVAGARVLLVEDNEINRQIAAEFMYTRCSSFFLLDRFFLPSGS